VFDLSLPSDVLAPMLVGALLTDNQVTLRVTEVEAYGGTEDPAAHAWRGPRPHTMDLFGEPGTLYCYRSHGLHTCGNIVCGATGLGSAILFRAGRVLAGTQAVRSRRGEVPERRLASGPGNLGSAMGWTLADSGRLFGTGGLQLEPGEPLGPVATGPRTGVSVAWTRPWRFWDAGDDTVSAYRPSPRIVPGRYDW
jgi:DNA-3-methyladenine glycosylase